MGEAAPSLRVQAWDFKEIWSELRVNVLAVLRQPTKAPPKPFPTLDRYVHKLSTSDTCVNVPVPAALASKLQSGSYDVTAVRSMTLHHLLREVLAEHIAENVLPKVTGLHDGPLLDAYVLQYEAYNNSVRLISSMFRYLRTQCQRSRDGTAVAFDTYHSSLAVWRDVVFSHVATSLMAAVEGFIRTDREFPSNRIVLRKVLSSLTAINADQKKPLGLYQSWFEHPFIAATERYCAALVMALERLPVSDYMEEAERILRHELRRAQECMDRSTWGPLKRTLVSLLVESRLATLLAHSEVCIDNGMSTDLHRLYWLLGQCEGGMEPMRKRIEDRIDAEGRAEVERVAAEAQRDPAVLIQTIIAVHSKYEQLVTTVFDNNQQLQLALQVGCRRFINHNALYPDNSGKAAEYLAKFLNTLLRPNRVTTDDQVESMMDKAVVVFLLLEDRDVFQQCYGMLLAVRLIFGSFEENHEERMIAKFKQVCGHEFTYKWQRMFTDAVCNVRGLHEQFQRYVEDEVRKRAELPAGSVDTKALALANAPPPGLGDRFVAMVLMSGSWPISVAAPSPLPPPCLRADYEAFEAFYKATCQGRRLQWIAAYSHGVLRNTVPFQQLQRHYELSVSQAQATLLFAVDEVPAMGFASVMEVTGLDAVQCERALAPLIRIRLLACHPATATVPQQVFSINPGFFSAQRKIALIGAREGGATVPVDADAVGLQTRMEDRRYAIQAAVVRIMKARRSLEYSKLVAEVAQALLPRFTPTMQDIKVNIDALLEKEYLERSSEDPSLMMYAA